MNNNNSLDIKLLRKYVIRNEYDKLDKVISFFHPKDIKISLEDWTLEEKVELISKINIEKSAEIFLDFDPDEQEKIILLLTPELRSKLMSEMDSDDAADIIGDISEAAKELLLSETDDQKKSDINTINQYDENEVGNHMSLNFISLNINNTINDARKYIKKEIELHSAELGSEILVVDDNQKLVGSITIEELTISTNETKLSHLVKDSKSMLPNELINQARYLISDYQLDILPITSLTGKLLGVIYPWDIVEQITEIEIKKSSWFFRGKKVKEYKPYNKKTATDLFKERIFWILALLFIGLITQIIITGFQLIWSSTGFWGGESVIVGTVGALIVTLAFSSAISISSSVNDSAGNTASQSSSVIIEALAHGEIKPEDQGKILLKEFKTSIMMGGTIFIGSVIRTYLVWTIMIPAEVFGVSAMQASWMFVISVVAAVSFFMAIVFGNLIGAWIPLIGNKRRWKSSVISGPVSTTIIDIFVFAFYLGITTAIFVPLSNSGFFV